MTAVKWIAAAFLVWGLFIGIGYAVAPLVTDGWGNTWSTAVGLGVIGLCSAGLLWLNPRRG
jgi:hypothetical protein